MFGCGDLPVDITEVITKLHATGSRQNRTTLQDEQPELRRLKTARKTQRSSANNAALLTWNRAIEGRGAYFVRGLEVCWRLPTVVS